MAVGETGAAPGGSQCTSLSVREPAVSGEAVLSGEGRGVESSGSVTPERVNGIARVVARSFFFAGSRVVVGGGALG